MLNPGDFMPIKVSRTSDGYSASVTPSKYRPLSWKSPRPMTDTQLVEKLVEMGYHMQDIADALHEADLAWEAR